MTGFSSISDYREHPSKDVTVFSVTNSGFFFYKLLCFHTLPSLSLII